MKRNVFLGLLVIVLVFGFISCGDDCDHKEWTETAALRTEAIIFKLGERTYGANVTATMKRAEFDALKTQLVNAINAAFLAAGTFEKIAFEDVFGYGDSATINVGTAGGNAFYQVETGKYKTLNLNAANVNNLTSAQLIAAVELMYNETAGFAKINNWQLMKILVLG